jgi:hypothetical protein
LTSKPAQSLRFSIADRARKAAKSRNSLYFPVGTGNLKPRDGFARDWPLRHTKILILLNYWSLLGLRKGSRFARPASAQQIRGPLRPKQDRHHGPRNLVSPSAERASFRSGMPTAAEADKHTARLRYPERTLGAQRRR